MGAFTITRTRVAGAISIVALIAFTASDFLATEFWDDNSMATSIVADVLVLIVGVAVVNEFVATRARSRWQLVADYALFELARSCRRIWVGLAEQIGVGSREEMTREELRQRVDVSISEDRIVGLARQAADSPAKRAELYQVVSDLVHDARGVLTSWAAVLVESTRSDALDRFAEVQTLLTRLNLVLWDEAEGKRPSTEQGADPHWIAHRVRRVTRLASKLELELIAEAKEIEARENAEAVSLGPAAGT